jgi:hypothetical protein
MPLGLIAALRTAAQNSPKSRKPQRARSSCVRSIVFCRPPRFGRRHDSAASTAAAVLRRHDAAAAFAEALVLRGEPLAALDVVLDLLELGEDRVDLGLLFGGELALLRVGFRLDCLAGLIELHEPGP